MDIMQKLKACVKSFPDLVAVSKIVIQEIPFKAPNNHSTIAQNYWDQLILPIEIQEWMSSKKRCTTMGLGSNPSRIYFH